VKVFCALSKERLYGPFFMETTTTGIVYLNMLQQYLIAQLDKSDQEGRIHFQQDGAPPFPPLITLEKCASTSAPVDWQSGADSMATSFSDLTPPDFFLWEFAKDRVFVPRLPTNVDDLRTRIIAAVAELTPETLRSVCQEIDYGWEVCRTLNHNYLR
jgi:hypothetical protein